jgi:hypothetical protein
MPKTPKSPDADALIGQVVVLDLSSPYVCIGTLSGIDDRFFRVLDADLHDFRDSPVTRENYVFDSLRLGIRRNRTDVLIRREEVVAITRFGDLVTS